MPLNARRPTLDTAFALAVALALHLLLLSNLSYLPPQPDAADFAPIAVRLQPSSSDPQPASVPIPQKPPRDPAPDDVPNKTANAPQPKASQPPAFALSAPPQSSPKPTSNQPSPVTRAPTPPPQPPAAPPPAPSVGQLLADAEALILQGASILEPTPLAPLGQDAPRRTYIDRATRDPNLAGYMAAWVEKVERVGALRYPTEIRRKRLSGQLTLDVAIRHDGSVAAIDLLRPSRYPELDRAAERIVRLAAPYAPLPEAIRADTDILHITRVWRFTPGDLQAFD